MDVKKIGLLLKDVESLEELEKNNAVLASKPKNEQLRFLKDIKSFMQYIGYAGEHRVMSELLLRGVDAMNSSIDEGFDLTVRREDKVFLVQVKTTFLNKKKKFVFDLRKENFEQRYKKRINYVVVFVMVEGIDKGSEKVNFLVMPVDELKKQKEAGKVWFSKTTKKYRVQIYLRDKKAFFWTLDNDVTEFLNNWRIFTGGKDKSKKRIA